MSLKDDMDALYGAMFSAMGVPPEFMAQGQRTSTADEVRSWFTADSLKSDKSSSFYYQDFKHKGRQESVPTHLKITKIHPIIRKS